LTLGSATKRIRLGLLLVVLLLAAGCGNARSVPAGRTAVTINIGPARIAAVAGARLTAASSVPQSIVNVRITITAPDMAKIERVDAVAGRTEISESFEVPNGKNRHFVVEGMDDMGYVLYHGEIYANLEGSPVSLAIMMVSSDPLPPVFGGLSKVGGATTTSLALSWDAASDEVSPPDTIQYLIYMATSSGGENYGAPVFTTDPGVTSFTVVGLSPGTKYYFVVRAMDEKGNVDTNSVEFSATTGGSSDSQPPAFGGLISATSTSPSTAALFWGAATDNVSSSSNMIYLVFVATTAGGEDFANPSLVTAAGATSTTVSGLKPDTTYYFVVRAKDEAGNVDNNTVEKSVKTPLPQDTTPPVFAGLVSATALSPTTGGLVWNAAIDDQSASSSIVYLVYMTASSGGENYASPSFVSAPGATSYAVAGLLPNTTYYFVVRAKDEAGNVDTNVVEKSITTPPPPDTIPPYFVGLHSATVSGTNVSLDWRPASDNVAIGGYLVFVSMTPGGEDFASPFATAGPAATSITVAMPKGGTTYYFIVRAQDTSGNTDSNTVEKSATTDIFVSAATGSDTTGIGTPASPFMTITKALGVSAGKPGLTINVAPGTYNPALGEIFPLNFSGTSGRTLNCSPGNSTITSAGSGQSAISGGPETTIRNCTIDGQNATLNCAELGATETLTGNTIVNCSQFGVVVAGGSPEITGNTITGNSVGIEVLSDAGGLNITGNNIYYNDAGIEVSGGNPRINNNRLYCNTINDNLVIAPAIAVVIDARDNSWDNDPPWINYLYSSCYSNLDICRVYPTPDPDWTGATQDPDHCWVP
jgi:predicted phage tail protein